MALFYFDATGGGAASITDTVGLPFVSIADARAHAMTLLPVMGVELPMSEGEFRTWTVIVRDDTDAIVCRFIMAIINDELEPGTTRMLRPTP